MTFFGFDRIKDFLAGSAEWSFNSLWHQLNDLIYDLDILISSTSKSWFQHHKHSKQICTTFSHRVWVSNVVSASDSSNVDAALQKASERFGQFHIMTSFSCWLLCATTYWRGATLCSGWNVTKSKAGKQAFSPAHLKSWAAASSHPNRSEWTLRRAVND